MNELAKKLRNHIKGKDTVYVCIGTDRSTGDALGPLVGDRLKILGYKAYGTTKDLIHAGNLEQKMQEIKSKHPHSTIVAIDASLGRSERVGVISVSEGPLKPGEYFQDYGACPLDFGDGFDCEDIPELECHEEERCWKEYFLWKARAAHE